ncbi:MAG: NHL repeat-containing protein [bacterium]|nr:NHL repeat-containing protein [bacterium]
MKGSSPVVTACLIWLSVISSALALNDIDLSRAKQPSSIASSPGGQIYIIDKSTTGVLELGPDGVIKTSALYKGFLNRPRDIACRGKDIVVLDGTDIWYLDTGGRLQESLSLSGLGLKSPRAFCLDNLGFTYVTDTVSSSVYKIDPEGKVVVWIGRWGSETGSFVTPVDVVVDRERNFYVADWDLSRVQKFDPMGRFVMTVGEAGEGPGLFKKISAIAVDESGQLLVADYFDRKVQVFFPDGSYRGSIADVGLPADIMLLEGVLYVLDIQSNSLRRFSLDHLSVEVAESSADTSGHDDSGPAKPQPVAGVTRETVSVDEAIPESVPGEREPEVAKTAELTAGALSSDNSLPALDDDVKDSSAPPPDTSPGQVGYRVSLAGERKIYAVDIRKLELLPGGARSAELEFTPIPKEKLFPRSFRVYEDRVMRKVITVQEQAQGVIRLGYSGGASGRLPDSLIVIVSEGQRVGKGTWKRVQDKE